MKRCYIAGPMRGVPKYNFPAFFAAEKALRDQGWEVENPARMDVELDGLDPDDPKPITMDIQHYLKRDLPAIERSEAIVLLTGWTGSDGVTKHELPYALELGKDTYTWFPASETLALLPPYSTEEFRATAQTGGLRLDTGKPRVELVPPSSTIAIAEVLGASSEPRGKYPERNWERGMKWSKSYAPAMRHLLAWWQGEDIDKESGLPHLWHAHTDLAFLVEWARTGTGEDDRPKGNT